MIYKTIMAAIGQEHNAMPSQTPPAPTSKHMAEFYDAWRANMHANGITERTQGSYIYDLQRFVAWLEKRLGRTPTVLDPNHQEIVTFRDSFAATRAPRTVALMLCSIRSYQRYLIMIGARVDDPTLHIVYPTIDRHLPGRSLSRAKVRELLAALHVPDNLTPGALWQWQRNRRCIYIMLYAGLRIGEVRNLRRRDIQFDLGYLDVRNGKGGKDRTVPIHPVLIDILQPCEDWRPSDAIVGSQGNKQLAAKSLNHLFERWIPTLGLSWTFSSHDLRHTFCQTLVEANGELSRVQECMGHEDPKTTGIYYRLQPEHLRSTIQLLPTVW